VLDPSVLTGHGFDGLGHGSGRDGSRPRVQRVGSDPSGFFYNSTSIRNWVRIPMGTVRKLLAH
jgi:hypothetical protein